MFSGASSKLHAESGRTEANQSKLAKPHSKSNIVGDSSKLDIGRSLSHAAEIRRLVERKTILCKAVEDALAKNQILLAEAKRKAALHEEYEEERSMTSFLSIMLDATEEQTNT
jgi:hypothetical protein